MNVIKPYYRFVDPEKLTQETKDCMVKKLASVARVCYKSDSKGIESDYQLVKNCAARQHWAMLEHASLTVLFTCSRAIANELVRHRLASFAQESLRYVDYDKQKFELAFVKPPIDMSELDEKVWRSYMYAHEQEYKSKRAMGFSPEIARRGLPLDTATKIVVTANLREWNHILSLRADGTTGKPDPEMLELMQPLAEELRNWLPEVFGENK